jgi:uncharacterized protein (TIGR02996 family)
MTPLDGFDEHLTSQANDWDARAILADWFEEQGSPAVADCLHWMVRRRKRSCRGRQGR